MPFLLLLWACAPLGTTDPGVQLAADLFLAGSAEEADSMVEADDMRVIEELRSRTPDGSDPVAFVRANAADVGIGVVEDGRVVETCDYHIQDDSDRVAWSEAELRELKRAQVTAGSSVNCVATFDVGCEVDELVASLDMGHHQEASDIDEYVDSSFRIHHPGPAARALLSDANGEVVRLGWLEDPWNISYNVYLCVPWQLVFHVGPILGTHDPNQWH